MNIYIIEVVTAHFHYWINFLKMLVTLNKTFENFFNLLLKILKNEFPIDSVLKNKTHLLLESFNAVFLVAYSQKISSIKYNIENDIVIISSSELLNKEIKFHGGVNNGDIIYGFVGNDYWRLPVHEKTVIDVGANIGDTPIYFALHGANKVIGLEPFPKNYELAVENTLSNGFSDKIKIVLAGCSSRVGEIIIDPDYESNIESQIRYSAKGTIIPLLTIEEIVKRYDVPDGSILKMDCEGCEYDSILHTPDKVLQKFSHIQIEYHTGYRTLKEKLEACGFSVSITKPVAIDVLHTLLQSIQEFLSVLSFKTKDLSSKNNVKFRKKHKIGYTGFIFAKNNENTTIS